MRAFLNERFKANRGHFTFRAILTYTLLSFSYAIVSFHKAAPSVLTLEMSQSYNCSESNMTIFSSMYFWTYAAMQPFAGIAADIFDPSLILAIGSFVSSAGALITGLTSNYMFSLVGRFLVGIGTSPIYVCICQLLTTWYPMEKYAIFSGGIGAVSGLGSVATTASLDWIAAKFGWKISFIAIAIVGTVFAILVLIFVRDCPQRLGYPAVNDYAHQAEAETWSQTLTKLKNNISEVFSKTQIYMISLYKFFIHGFYNNITSLWGGAYIEDVFPNYDVGILLTSLSISMIIGSLALPVIARYIKSKRWILIVCSILTTVVSIVFIFFDDEFNFASLYAVLFIWSLLSGPTSAIAHPLLAQAYSHEANATALGFANVFSSLGCAIFQHLTDYFLMKGERVQNAFTRATYTLGLWIPSAICAFVSALGPLFCEEKSAEPEKKAEETNEEEPSEGNYNKIL